MQLADIIAHHIAAKTPLRRLGNSVRWFEESAARCSRKDEARDFKAKARVMRRVVTAVFVERFTTGEYAED